VTVPIDYEVLRLIWWLFLGVLLIGFAIMDGFDLGVAMLLPYVARQDVERRVTINAIGPVWEGNQVWLILGGGAVFAAWPPIYAASFSGFYIAMFLVLATLILRPVGFDFRNKIADARWRAFWDYALFAGGVVPSVVFGVAFGNLLQGVPFRIDSDLRIHYEGSGLFELLNPFGLLCGILSAAMLATHGAVYLALKTEGVVAQRARLRHHQPDRDRWPLEPAHEDRGSPARAVARQLRGASVDGRRTLPRLAWPAARIAVHHAAAERLGVHRQRGRHYRHHRHRRREHVPVHDAFRHRARREPHRVGCLVEQRHPVRDAGGDSRVPADRHRLHGDCVPELARRGDGKPDRAQSRRFLLRKHHVVFRLDSRSEFCLRVRHPQRRVARVPSAARKD
jgi:hypothetical protein